MSAGHPGSSASLDDVLRTAGVAHGHYKSKCIERRLAARMRARGAATYDEYVGLLQADPDEAKRLAQALTISVSRFFRNWNAFQTLRELVVPELWQRTEGPIRVWSAGCSAGEEPYSVAALFHDYATAIRQSAQIGRVSIVGTDVDEQSLAAARRGMYSEAALAEAPEDLRNSHFRLSRGTASVNPELRQLVRFERHDLVLDEPLKERFHLILCRNVIIYLERHAQEDLLRRFHRATVPAGFLLLGKVEAVIGPGRAWFRPVVIRSRLYRRVGT